MIRATVRFVRPALNPRRLWVTIPAFLLFFTVVITGTAWSRMITTAAKDAVVNAATTKVANWRDDFVKSVAEAQLEKPAAAASFDLPVPKAGEYVCSGGGNGLHIIDTKQTKIAWFTIATKRPKGLKADMFRLPFCAEHKPATMSHMQAELWLATLKVKERTRVENLPNAKQLIQKINAVELDEHKYPN